MSIPVSEIRQRLACIWPIILAGETLKRVAMAEDLLNPAVNVKVPRSVVYRDGDNNFNLCQCVCRDLLLEPCQGSDWLSSSRIQYPLLSRANAMHKR